MLHLTQINDLWFFLGDNHKANEALSRMLKNKDYDSLIKIYICKSNQEPNDYSFHLTLANLYYLKGNFPSALDCYEEFLNKNPNSKIPLEQQFSKDIQSLIKTIKARIHLEDINETIESDESYSSDNDYKVDIRGLTDEQIEHYINPLSGSIGFTIGDFDDLGFLKP